MSVGSTCAWQARQLACRSPLVARPVLQLGVSKAEISASARTSHHSLGVAVVDKNEGAEAERAVQRVQAPFEKEQRQHSVLRGGPQRKRGTHI